jgi:hypothetical protein
MTKFNFFAILADCEQKDTVTTTASIQAPSIRKKQVEKIEAKKKDSFCTSSSHAVQLVKKVQPLQHQAATTFHKPSNSPRFKFNKCFPISHENSTQWIPLIPKEGGLIEMDIGGHPPIPLAQITIFHFGIFLQFLESQTSEVVLRP